MPCFIKHIYQTLLHAVTFVTQRYDGICFVCVLETAKSAKRVETLFLLRNLGQIPPLKSFQLPPPRQTMLFSYRQLLFFLLPTLKGGGRGRGGSASGKCNIKVIFP